MTIDEKIKLLESQIAETNELLAEIKQEKENEEKKNTESVLAEYWNCLSSGEVTYYVDDSNKVYNAELFETYDDTNTDRYSNYPTKEYAEQAQKIKEFNDKLLAFKYCYDRDYKVAFSGDYDNRAYYIYFDSEDGKYNYDWDNICDRNIIYFSSKEIARKCCDWLNAEMEEE